MTLLKKTSEYTISKRRDDRFSVIDANKKPINGDEKVKILLAEGLITIKAAAPVAAPEVEEAPAAEEAPAE
ncbi:MAG: hypothetical protein ACI9WS_000105 [Paraglaciecola psychrophila]|jgi:hypothetical protein